jgi:hypothetical protein
MMPFTPDTLAREYRAWRVPGTLLASLPTDADVDKLLDGLPTADAILDSLPTDADGIIAGLPEPNIGSLLDEAEQPALPFGGPATTASTATPRQAETAVNTGHGNGNGNRCHPADPLPATRYQPVADPLPSSRRGGR